DAVADGAACDDGAFCTVGDRCAAGACGGDARDCAAAGDLCNDGRCDEARRACLPAPAPPSTPCDDGLFCTLPDRCVVPPGAARAVCRGSPRACDDGASCTHDRCDEGAGRCIAAPENALCQD